jgi:hypothetical protein
MEENRLWKTRNQRGQLSVWWPDLAYKSYEL